MSGRALGRRPGDSEVTRQSILSAARHEFGRVGFDRATIRSIAGAADVDPGLVIHYFKNKRRLFVDAHELPLDPSELFASVAELPVDTRAEALAAAYLGVFAGPHSPGLSMLRAAATNDDAAALMREFVTRALIEHAPNLVEGADAELRLAMIGSHLIGIVCAREFLGLEPLRRATIDDLVALAKPALESYIRGEPDPRA